MFFASRPSLTAVDRFLKQSEALALSYSPVGLATRSRPLPQGFDTDETAVSIGHGRACFDRAEAAIGAWKHFELAWVELFPHTPSVEPGTVVAVLVKHLGFWSLNGCRVVYGVGRRGQGTSFGFAYGTLTNHAERGEEIFEVSRHPESGEVIYRIRAVSQPRALVARLGRPVVRALQAKFRRHSAEALRRAM